VSSRRRDSLAATDGRPQPFARSAVFPRAARASAEGGEATDETDQQHDTDELG
jgi:hypothetical protein